MCAHRAARTFYGIVVLWSLLTSISYPSKTTSVVILYFASCKSPLGLAQLFTLALHAMTSSLSSQLDLSTNTWDRKYIIRRRGGRSPFTIADGAEKLVKDRLRKPMVYELG